MLHQFRGKADAGQHIFLREGGIGFQNVLDRIARRQKLKDGSRSDPCAPNRRLPIADVRLDDDAIHDRQANGK